MNLWDKHADKLTEGYIKKSSSIAGNIRFDIVTKSLLNVAKNKNLRVLDIGGGFGWQAIQLARHGYSVTIVDSDQIAIEFSKHLISHEEPHIQKRVDFLYADGEEIKTEIEGKFDLVCCHSVLMYIKNIEKILKSIAELTKSNGLISILNVNVKSIAMRSGLQKKWDDALASINNASQSGDIYLSSYDHENNDIIAFLEPYSINLIERSGVGIFTDHLNDNVKNCDYDKVLELEWNASQKEPYKSIARQEHLILRKS